MSTRRQQLVTDLMHAMRRTSAQGVLFSQTVATRVGIGGSDLECLDIILLAGRATAGELAKATGLTTGAITGVADRLEKAGFVRRARDASDRRKVWLEALPRVQQEIAPWFGSLGGAMNGVLRDYDMASLRLLLDFYDRAGRVLVTETGKLQEAVKAGRPSGAKPSKRLTRGGVVAGSG